MPNPALLKNDVYSGTKHSAYSMMRRIKDGYLPRKNTVLRKTLDEIEHRLIDHFGTLNVLQEVQLGLLRPLIAFYLLHPGTNDSGDSLNQTYMWAYRQISIGMKSLDELSKSTPPDKPLDIIEYLSRKTDEKPKHQRSLRRRKSSG